MAGMARAMGATLIWAQKLAWQKIKFFLQFLERLYFAPPQLTASTQRSYVMQDVLYQHHQAL